MKIEEMFLVSAPIERVWAFITDPAQVAPCVPGCEAVEVVGPNAYKSRIKVALGPIKTTFNVNVELTELQPPVLVCSVTRGEEGGRASTLSAQNILKLTDHGNGETEVYYASEVSVVGRLGKFGLAVMKKRAKAMGEEFALAFRRRIEVADG